MSGARPQGGGTRRPSPAALRPGHPGRPFPGRGGGGGRPLCCPRCWPSGGAGRPRGLRGAGVGHARAPGCDAEAEPGSPSPCHPASRLGDVSSFDGSEVPPASPSSPGRVGNPAALTHVRAPRIAGRKAGLLPAACPARQRGPILLPLRSADARHTPVPGAGRRRSQHELTRGGFRHHPLSDRETERLARGAGTGPGGLNPDRSCPSKPGSPMRHRKSVRPRPSAGAWGVLLSPPPLAKGRGGGRCPEAELPPSPHPQPEWGSPGTQAREGWCSPPST